MKRIIFLMMLFVLVLPVTAHANELVTLKNYHYVHTNEKGSKQYLKDKNGSTVIYGDANEHDAVIKRVSFVKNGLQSGESLYIIYPDGSTQAVTGDSVTLSKTAENIRIAIDKTTVKETYVKVSSLTTYDQSNGGINVDYLYTMDTPKDYGSLGDGSSGGGGTDPGGGTDTSLPLQWNNGTRRITWSKYPADCYEIIVTDPDGTKYNIVPSTKVFKVDDRGGKYTFVCKRLDGSVIVTKTLDVPEAVLNPDPGTDPGGTDPGTDPGGTDPGTDPGGGECTTNGCDWLNDIIFCPGWDVVMADLTLAIKDALPPPPDWNYVSHVFSNTIVPAMGQELVNRSYEIAKIIADEFQSREKPVSPPPYVEDFTPNVPVFQDTPRVRDSLDKDIPNFDPSYTDDKPFIIPNPDDHGLTDYKDKGYVQQKPVNTAPDYKSGDSAPEPDPGYKPQEPNPSKPPDYQTGDPTPEKPPDYQHGESGKIPDYNTNEPTGNAPDYQHNENSEVPIYKPGN